MRKPTIWESLSAKLGREPTNAECRDECRRIIADAYAEVAGAGMLPFQRRRRGR